MDRKRSITLGLIAVLGLPGLALYAQKPADLVGTWSGQATLVGVEAPNELTLVLELKEGKLAGAMSDQYGTIDQFPIGEIVLEKGVLSFVTAVVGPGGQQATIKYKMTISGDTMKGTLEIPEMGRTGAWEAAKRK
jgi:hypothetical protein